MKQVDYEIKEGDAGIRQTVQEMARLIKRDAANPKIIKKARSLRGKNERDSIRNIFDYVWKNYKYKNDPDDREVVSAPIQLFNCAEGEDCQLPKWAGRDCDDLTVVLAALYKAAGFKPLIKIIDWKPGQDGFTHVYPLVLIPGEEVYIPTDPVAKEKGWQWEKTPVKRYEVYDIDGNLVDSYRGKTSDLAETMTHKEAGNIKEWWQYIEEHAALITSVAAITSIGVAIYFSSKNRNA